MRPAPLPVQNGLGPARVRLRDGGRVLAELHSRFGAGARAKVLAGEVVDADGVVVTDATVLPACSHVYLYRELRDEVPVPFDMPVLYRDDDLVVADKPHFLATMPRGRHVAQTAVVRLRRELDLPELSPAHRLDRLTAGRCPHFTTRRELRGRYQTLFANGLVRKTYLARTAGRIDVECAVRRSRIIKRRGQLQAVEEPGVPTAETLIEHVTGDLYRLTPETGRTHQLRVHMAALGLPLLHDPLYPAVIDVAPDDFSQPLQLLAHSIEFDDSISGRRRRFVSTRTLGGP